MKLTENDVMEFLADQCSDDVKQHICQELDDDNSLPSRLLDDLSRRSRSAFDARRFPTSLDERDTVTGELHETKATPQKFTLGEQGWVRRTWVFATGIAAGLIIAVLIWQFNRRAAERPASFELTLEKIICHELAAGQDILMIERNKGRYMSLELRFRKQGKTVPLHVHVGKVKADALTMLAVKRRNEPLPKNGIEIVKDLADFDLVGVVTVGLRDEEPTFQSDLHANYRGKQAGLDVVEVFVDGSRYRLHFRVRRVLEE